MLQKILLTILSSLFLLSCAKLPPKPKGILCVMHVAKDDSGQVIVDDTKAVCAPIDGDEDPQNLTKWERTRLVLNDDDKFDVPLVMLDNFVTTSPDTWGNIVSYIDKLKGIIERNCQ